ncbi:MAG: hypothetical protein FJW32_19655 [Acidobacteria bacterium]|nr:hypothetical protein [Acidobacteriota bacterium]
MVNAEAYMRYISNQLSESERDSLREKLLADSELSDSFADWENEAIDSLARGRLSPADAAVIGDYLAATNQQNRIALAAALSKPRRAAISPYAMALGLAAIMLLTFPVARLWRDRNIAAPAAVAVQLFPGTLRTGGAVQQVPRSAGQRIQLQLQYLDASPSGKCRVEIEAIVVESDCGAAEHGVAMPIGMASGRHRVDLIYNNGADRFVYFFDLID